MSTLRRFRGTAFGIVALVAAAGAWIVVQRATSEPDPVGEQLQEPIFRFEKEDLVGFEIVRPDATIAMRQVDGVWRVEGRDWRPSAAMVRKVAHQLHDLTARATVVDSPEDYAVYGLGDDAITVTLHLADGRELGFRAGDPNPTGVSWYIRPIPGERVYVVKKSALDMYRLDVEAYREAKFALFDARDVERLDAVLPDRTLAFERVGEHTWRQTAPIAQAASRDEVRMMLGRISALRASVFVEDHPTDLARYGLEPPAGRITVGVDTGEVVTIVVGAAIPATEPPERYVLRVEDDAVYQVRDGLLEPFGKPVGDYRDRVIVGRQAWDVTAMSVTYDGETIALTRTSDDWRWPDGQAVPGSTPERVAGRAADLRAVGFHDDPPAADGLDAATATVALTFTDGSRRTISLGRKWRLEAASEDAPAQDRQYAALDGDPTVYEVDGQLISVVEDLSREYRRKREREAERRVDLGEGGG